MTKYRIYTQYQNKSLPDFSNETILIVHKFSTEKVHFI